MLDELRPMGLSAAARSLGVDLFEVVRLLVASETGPDSLRLTPEHVEQLRVFGGIERPWWPDVELPEDEHPLRQRVRAAVQQLLDRGYVGAVTTRMDNVWRGLPTDDQVFLQTALTALGEEGVLAITATPAGMQVAVVEERVDVARAIADGRHDTPGLTALYQE